MADPITPAGILAHLRFPVAETLGRKYPEPPHPYRNDFRRDRDRVVHSRAFRRLENKTQVFTPDISDHFRNRLTHTIEVSQIARTAAAALGLDEDLIEALALVHDIGHPPFGHAGETVLDEIMRGFGARFDHNFHALRTVETFENRYARFPGLNLTFEVREGIVKHSRDFVPSEFPELDQYLPGQKPPLEAQLIDLCDEIAYNTADLDDAYHAGMIRVAEARDASPKFAELYEIASGGFPGAPERVQVHEVVRGLIDWFVSRLILGTTEAAAEINDVADVRRHPRRLARLTPEAAQESARLKRFLRTNVYESASLAESRQNSAKQVERLFAYLLAHPESLPPAYREEAAAQPLHFKVCDYIAGMTDRFFARACSERGIA